MSGEWFNAIHWRSLDSAINKTFKSMHQSVITKIKNFACVDWIVLDVL